MVFSDKNSAKMNMTVDENIAPTLRGTAIPSVFENHSQDTRYKGPLDISPTVSATYGMGGNNQPFVVESKVQGAEQ